MKKFITINKQELYTYHLPSSSSHSWTQNKVPWPPNCICIPSRTHPKRRPPTILPRPILNIRTAFNIITRGTTPHHLITELFSGFAHVLVHISTIYKHTSATVTTWLASHLPGGYPHMVKPEAFFFIFFRFILQINGSLLNSKPSDIANKDILSIYEYIISMLYKYIVACGKYCTLVWNMGLW